tara:strand:+ start:197 stop:577 length:381 start_codon:yes stop_codon:yes gene_type:complete
MTLEEIAFFCQSCASKSPAIVLGSGASIPYGIKGMTELANWLVAEVTPQCEPETDAWTLVRTALANGDHLEQALENKALPETLVIQIVRRTWDFISLDDYILFKSAISGNTQFPLQELFAGLFRST